MDTKKCTKCQNEKPLDEFHNVKRNKDGKHNKCKTCASEYQKSLRNRPERVKQRTEYNRRWREANPDKVAAWRPKAAERTKAAYQRKRAEVLEAYGNECACCNESTVQFLTLDHKNGRNQSLDAGKERNGTGTVYRLHKLLPKLDPDIEILCWNCNSGRHINGGICPHKEIQNV